jgi:hypothetical protein
MKPDLYTKAVLTVIAFMLVLIGCHQYTSPATTVQAEGPFAGVQYSDSGGNPTFFDPKTGEVWFYSMPLQDGTAYVVRHWRIPKLGERGTEDYHEK